MFTRWYVVCTERYLIFLFFLFILISNGVSAQSNQAPVVNAGVDQNITLPNGASLNGTVTDDGNPGGGLKISWSQISGPVGVTFANPNVASTSAVFPATGTFTLRLTANDGQLTTTDDIIIKTVSGPGPNQSPIMTAGPDKVITLPVNSVTLNGSATDDGLPSPPSGLNITWSAIQAPAAVTFSNTKTPTTTVTFTTAAIYKFQLRVSDGATVKFDTVVVTVNPSSTNQAPVVNAGADQNITLPNSASLNGTATDDSNPGNGLVISWSQISGPVGVTFANPNIASTSAVFPAAGTFTLRLTASDGQLTTTDDIIIKTVSGPGPNQPPIMTAGPDKVITLPTSTVTLNGSATDDGLPSPPSGLNITWSAIQAPAAVTFSNTKTPTTTVTFTTAATYKFQLRVSDGATVKFDTVVVTVNPASNNQAPVVNAGADQNITLPNSASLQGTATDDGNPGSGLTISWSQVSGPVGVTFANPNIASTSAVFPAAGTFTLRLTASDGQLTTTDDIIIKTISGPGPNQPPIMTAGPDKVITLPTNTVTLDGSATDDGLPSPPSGLNITWSAIQAPAPVTFSSTKTPTTTITFTTAAAYKFQLRVSDGATVKFDTVSVIVNSTTANQAPIVNAGTDKSITLPNNSAAMTGSASDDGKPNPPGALTINWTQLNGPGTVTFSNVNSLTTNVTFPTQGTYNVILTAADGQLSNSDTVKIIVNPSQSTNQAPVVNAGADQNITLPSSASLNGTVTDDGNPGGGLTISWSQISGPVGVTFANPNIASTSAVFPAAGTFTLRLSASDGQLTTTDDIIVITTSGPGPDQPPIMTAGPDKVISLPINSVILNGSATDDGLPSPPSGLNITWSAIQAPAPVTFSSTKTPTTTITFTTAATYRFQLRVSDGATTKLDTVFVVVRPAPEIPAPLKTVQVPGPDKVTGFDFTQFVINKDAAIRLGKALFWDMQAGSDGVTACASCHFSAGTDNRIKNQLHPGNSNTFFTGKGPNYTLSLSDFPLSANKSDDDIVSSQGVFNTTFNDIIVGSSIENGTSVPDNIFKVGSSNTLRVPHRNSSTVINAVYTYRNFWDGRASAVFNGVNPFGVRDPNAKIFQVNGTSVVQITVAIPLSSLASQAAGPPLNNTEMSFNGRTFPKLGKKLLSLKPLGKQIISPNDSRLGTISGSPQPGVISTVTYASMIRDAFNAQWWNSTKIITFVNGIPQISDPPQGSLSTNQFTLMEANFALFWGLAIQLYESTLVSDDSKFDKFREGTAVLTAQEQNGLNLFMGKGKCINCHNGPEFTNASLTAKNKFGVVDRMIMKNGSTALYDIGFYNIGVRATNEDLSLGDNLSGLPLSFVKELTNNNQVDTFSFNTAKFQIPGPIQPGERVAVNGAFKVPSLRNIELTGPYFHNGGKATLKELLIAYNAGNLFRNENNIDMPPDIIPLNLTNSEEDDIISFLLTLTDERVRNQQAPFDHPQLLLPNGHPGDQNSVTDDGTGRATVSMVEFAAAGSTGGTPLTAFLNGDPFLGKAGAELENNEEENIPDKFTLEQNFPNPFNPSTTIRYKLPVESSVNLTIFNILGQEIITLLDEQQAAGSYEVKWNANNFSSGVYIYKLAAKPKNELPEFVQIKKMLMIK